ncbi:MAG TPA: hypothetical protein VH595_10495 [Verrucomicrobiae bacterium]|jgi:hypothetical protein|nr:hypothetical protein [Verrucomicrobiae bacterium]
MKQHNQIKTTAIRCFLAISAIFLPAFQAAAQTYSLSNTWTQIASASANPTNNQDTSADNRAMCYDISSNIVVANNKGNQIITTYDGNTGVSNGVVNDSGLSGGNFTLNKIGFASDGIMYGANLNTTVSPSSAYKLYSWTNLGVAPYNCYATTGSDALGVFTTSTSRRLGDTWAITGGGANMLILAGMGGTNAFALFYTTDGVNFTPTIITIPGTSFPIPGSGVQFGLCFYTNNTFLINPDGGSGYLYLVQFPTNYQTAPSPVIATVLATNTSVAGNWLDLSYSPSAGLLATHANASAQITLYSLPASNFSLLAELATTNLSFSTSTSINGNETGDVALGGAGFSNMIYTLDTSAGIQATAIGFAAAPLAPVISVEPVGGTVYTNAGSFVFSVSATGTQPLSYFWQYNTVSNLDTATDISGANDSTYTICCPLMTNASGWYDVVISNAGGVTSSIPVQLTVSLPTSSLLVTQLWSLAPGSQPYLDSSSYDTRGLAYDTNTGSVLVADKGTDFGIFVLDANTGTNKFTMNARGIGQTGDLFDLDQIGVGDDGVLYAGNLVPAGSGGVFGLVYWDSVSTNAAPYQSFLGDPGNGSGDRWGDIMAVRGAGFNTEILLGSYLGYDGGPSTNASLLTTPDGSNFIATTLTITNANGIPAGFCSLGIAFGASNTFWAKSPGFDLFQIAFDPATGNCDVLQDIPAPQNGTSAFNSMSSICLDVANNLLAGITFNDVPNDLSIYQLPSGGAAPYLFDQVFFPSVNGNIQANGVTAVKYPRMYSLDVNNGILAVTYAVPPPPSLPPFSTAVADVQGVGLVLTWQSVSNHTYQVESESALSKPGSWVNVGSPVRATGATTSYTNTLSTTANQFYRVVGQ